jgi:hypothetical protein
MKGDDKFKPDERQRGIVEIQSHLKGSAPYIPLVETYPDMEFSSLVSQAKSGASSGTVGERPKVMFDLALARSLQYSVASPIYLFKLGMHNKMRALYEGQRLVSGLKQ